jgi:hypothetical protein
MPREFSQESRETTEFVRLLKQHDRRFSAFIFSLVPDLTDAADRAAAAQDEHLPARSQCLGELANGGRHPLTRCYGHGTTIKEVAERPYRSSNGVYSAPSASSSPVLGFLHNMIQGTARTETQDRELGI